VTSTIVASFGLGIGAALALFSVVYAVVLNPFPYPQPERIVRLRLILPTGPVPSLATSRELHAIRESGLFTDVFAVGGWQMILDGVDYPESISVTQYSPNAMATLGVRPVLGRTLAGSDTPASHVVVLTDRFWRSHLGTRADVVGSTIRLNRVPHTIVGVIPDAYVSASTSVVMPLDTNDENGAWEWQGRLEAGVDIAVAQDRLSALVRQFARESPRRFPPRFTVQVASLTQLRQAEGFVPVVNALWIAALLLFVIGAANASILLIARGVARQHEYAVQMALGATRRRVVRQMLTESVILAAAGAVVGIALSYLAIPVVVRWLPRNALPGVTEELHVNLPLLWFTVTLTVLSGVVFGLLPALSSSKPIVAAMFDSGAGRTVGSASGRRWTQTFLAAQVALALVLVAGSAVAARTLLALYERPLGYEPRGVSVAYVLLPEGTHGTWADRADVFERIRQEISRRADAAALTVYSGIPPRAGAATAIDVPGRQGDDNQAVVQRISPDYLSALRIPLRRGRIWTQAENAAAAHVAVVNRRFVEQVLAGREPLGTIIRIPSYRQSPYAFVLPAPGADGTFEIVGVAEDSLNVGLQSPPSPAVFVPYTTMLGDAAAFVIRSPLPADATSRMVREAVRKAEPGQPVALFRTGEDVLAEDGWARERLVTALLVAFTTCATVLAAVGLYSIVAYSVARRVREFGVRQALGAPRWQLLWLAVSSVARVVAAGMVAGLVIAVVAEPMLRWLGMATLREARALTTAMVVMGMVATVAALIPAIRGTAVEPARALRIE
jgi:predicted permease